MKARKLREEFRKVGIPLEKGSGPTYLGHRLIVTFPNGVDRDAVLAQLALGVEAILPDEELHPAAEVESVEWERVKEKVQGRSCIAIETRQKDRRRSYDRTLGLVE